MLVQSRRLRKSLWGGSLVALCVLGGPAFAQSALDWSSFFGGSEGESASSLTLLDGDLVFAGHTTSDNLPLSADAHDSSRNPAGPIGRDAFLARLSSDGASLLYSSYLGGSGEDLATHVVRVSENEVLVVGQTDSSDFPVTTETVFAGGVDVFLARFDLESGALVGSTLFGGGQRDFPRGVVVEGDASIVLFGDTNSADLPAREGSADESLDGPSDFFVARFSASLVLESSRYVGGSGSERGGELAREPVGDLLLVGTTDSADIPTTVLGPGESIAGGEDGVIIRLGADFSSWKGARYLGGSANDTLRDIAIAERRGRVYLLGNTESDDLPLSADAIQTTRRGRDLVVAALDASTLGTEAMTLFGSAGSDTAFALRVGESAAPVLVASGLQGGLATTPGAVDPSGRPGCNPYCFEDAIIARLGEGLSHVQYASYLASSSGDSARALVGTVDLRIVGATGGADFPTTPGAFSEERNLGFSSAASDAFASSIDLSKGTPSLTVHDTSVSWLPLPHADAYDLVRGRVETLLAEGGLTPASVDQCLAESTSETTVDTPGLPLPGGAFWFLLRAERNGTPTSFDAIAEGQRGSRDQGLAGAAGACQQ